MEYKYNLFLLHAMLDKLKLLKKDVVYPLLTVYERLTNTGDFHGNLALFISKLYTDRNFRLSTPMNTPPDSYTIKRVSDYE
jgi:hypothetical protein